MTAAQNAAFSAGSGVTPSTLLVAIAGVTLTLLRDGEAIATTKTDSAGRYSFVDLQPGNYTIVETQPTNYLDSGANVGTNFGGNNSVSNKLSNIIIPGPIPDDSVLQGVNYNFGERIDPSKRNFLASSGKTAAAPVQTVAPLKKAVVLQTNSTKKPTVMAPIVSPLKVTVVNHSTPTKSRRLASSLK